MKKTSKKNGDPDRRTLFARLPQKIFQKLESLAAHRALKIKRRVTLQEVVVELIREA